MSRLQMKIESKIGPLYLVGSEKGLHGVYWKKQNAPMVNGGEDAVEKLLKKAARQLEEYLDGQRKKFELPLSAEGTDFQKRVWHELAKIIVPCHRVISSDGSMGGYAGGLSIKARLLELEQNKNL
jgi:methylated-DNA-[protein]-cysteine S-methyltransferase